MTEGGLTARTRFWVLHKDDGAIVAGAVLKDTKIVTLIAFAALEEIAVESDDGTRTVRITPSALKAGNSKFAVFDSLEDATVWTDAYRNIYVSQGWEEVPEGTWDLSGMGDHDG